MERKLHVLKYTVWSFILLNKGFTSAAIYTTSYYKNHAYWYVTLRIRATKVQLLHCFVIYQHFPGKSSMVANDLRKFNKQRHKPPSPHCFSIKNSVEFIQKVKLLWIKEREILISCNVLSLFPSVPITCTLCLISGISLPRTVMTRK